ncbi:MAG: DUF3572 domain-containing protein [Pseudomonadota bacterium]
MERRTAETLAAEALAWIAADQEILGTFMGATGVSPDDLRTRAGDAEFLGSVLDFILMDDAWVTGFCEASGRGLEQPLRARAALPGGENVHWT